MTRTHRWPRTAAFFLAVLTVAASSTSAAERSPRARLSEAREQQLAGDYDAALKTYESLLGDPSHAPAAAAGTAEVCILTGKYEDALSRLDAVSEPGGASDVWQVARAKVLVETGRYGDALAAARRASELNPRNTTARLIIGQIHEVLSEYEQALEAYRWFENLLARGYPASVVALTDAGIALHRCAVLKPGSESPQRTRYVLQELLQPAAEQIDPRYWPARLASADLLFSKYNLVEAAEDYEAALKLNPKLADAHVGLGRIALEQWQFEKVERELTAAFAANPHSVPAHRLKARLHMTERKYKQAAAAAGEALKINPNDLESLGLLAAAHLRDGRQALSDAALKRAEAVNPRSPAVPAELAGWLAAARQFPAAEAYFKRAIELAPHWPQPRTALGMMYMESGEESEARKVLDAAWSLDPYNASTKNTLDLLDKLERFGRHESPHFIVHSDESLDAAVRPYLAVYMESIYAEVCRQFGGDPKNKTVIELFPSHDSFAVRVTGKPWIHTIGACTGRVIAIDAPRHSAAGRRFNWARVLRHEFTHTVTLAATQNRIPHWFTEGLAVRAEFQAGAVRSWEWCKMLSQALRTGRLFTLETLDWAFVRPRRAGDRMLAYAQSEWMVEYLVARHGNEIIARLLEAYAKGAPQPEIFRAVIGVPPERFHEEFLAWAGEQVQRWGLPVRPLANRAEIERRIEAAPEAELPELLADLSESCLIDGELAKAEEAARRALAGDPEHVRALQRLQTVLQVRSAKTKDKEEAAQLNAEALEHARKLARLDPRNSEAAGVLALAAIKAGDTASAIEHLETIKKVQPNDPEPYRRLAGIYSKTAEHEKALRELIALASLEDDDLDLPLKIAELQINAGRPAEAAEWLQRAVYIDPYAGEIHEQRARLLMQTDRFAEAAEEFDVLARLEPEEAAHVSDLAIALHRSGQTDAALAAARRAVALDENAPAKVLLTRD